MNYVHFGSAFLLFLSFAIFCLYFFQKQDESEPQSTVQQNKKKNRNRYYQFCGWGILLSITMIAVFSFVFKEEDYPNNTFIKYSTIIFETTALFFFSTSWLMKSSDILSPKIPLLRYFR
jgi:low temperature requirement protein LtrA